MVLLLWCKRFVMAVNTSTSGSWGFLTLHRMQGGFFSMVKSKQCDLNREEVREQVRGMMMTVCDRCHHKALAYPETGKGTFLLWLLLCLAIYFQPSVISVAENLRIVRLCKGECRWSVCLSCELGLMKNAKHSGSKFGMLHNF